ncbi:precorrin-6y C5,15-methyltransferase (decarboxylating) subunit CbiE [Chitinophaga sp. S165]|uniref:precorrin-6y C5,15-methyltransferase (decarboxylating) subunit CbiE n=1 Tax=Chitinophaga sp. S165 TaxID=2135462 RepID=UPI000D876F93|nr:precorrin-6y C5,15-methyltransferase (decarboxylating) subunit CbiE [Chitinophaga sp. S165]PWV56181.1 precorrin-6Y C5,15-methyltransferase (decarboxylating) [Chitinophaga sp. S165]
MEYIVIGISNSPSYILPDEVRDLLPLHKVFSGGKRHYELVGKYLPDNHHWIDIQGNMPALFDKFREHKGSIVVFASGDPLFYGFAGTIQKFDPEADVKVYPYFNSIQLLCHANNLSYADLVNVSVHGRTWNELDNALITQASMIGVLTDQQKTPAVIAQRMLEYGFSNYNMIVGEDLDGQSHRSTSLSLDEATGYTAHSLNCVILIRKSRMAFSHGIPDHLFYGLENRPNMITKMPVRLVSLSCLALAGRSVLWDIGFCTGSISVEARRQYPHLQVVAFEQRPECSELLDKNMRRYSAPGIIKVMGDFFETELDLYPSPDAVFIGGHGGRLEELIRKLDSILPVYARIVLNAVKEDSRDQFTRMMEILDYKLIDPIVIQVDEHNPITILTAEKR